MKKTDRNLLVLGMAFATVLVISNVVTAKTVQTGIPLFDSTILIPAAVVCYPITFLITDVIGEIWGVKEAQAVVLAGFGCQIGATLLIVLAGILPASDEGMQASYGMVLGQNYLFVIASLAAYMLAQSWDVFIFHKIRGFFVARSEDGARHRWIWNNASTMTSQIIDTFVFIGGAFGLGMGWFFDAELLPQLFAMMVGQYAIKFVVAALDTPIFYWLTRKGDRALAR